MKSKLFVQFYQKPFSDVGPLVQAIGDRSVIVLDGRISLNTHISFCRKECKERGFAGFSINQGSFSTYRIIVPLECVEELNSETLYELQHRSSSNYFWDFYQFIGEDLIKDTLKHLREKNPDSRFRIVKHEVLPL